jgi:hypothetical protein
LLIWVFAIHKHHLNMKVDRKKLYTARFIFNFNTLIKLHILLGKITNEIWHCERFLVTKAVQSAIFFINKPNNGINRWFTRSKSWEDGSRRDYSLPPVKWKRVERVFD